MPTRNVIFIGLAIVISLSCYSVASKNRYAGIFSEAMQIVRRDALIEIPERELFNSAINGMLSTLDENSTFISQDQFPAFDQDINQEFFGVGMTIEADAELGCVRVLSPMPGTPAFNAGMKVGDRIQKINGKSTRGITQEQAINLIRGPKGEAVDLLVDRDEFNAPRVISIVREAIPVPSVYGDTRNTDGTWNFYLHEHPEIGYIRLQQFGKRSTEEMRETLHGLDGKVSSLILDLRFNPGGLLDSAVEISDMFIAREVLVVLTKQRNQRVTQRRYATSNTEFDAKLPVVVIVNQYSASASEIVAACLQDHHRAIVVGTQTFGKGTVQDLITLEPRRSVLRLTTASYWRPSGKNIDRTVFQPAGENDYGVSPDAGFAVELNDDDLRTINEARSQRDQLIVDQIKQKGTNGHQQKSWIDVDLPLRRAVEYLKSVGQKKTAA